MQAWKQAVPFCHILFFLSSHGTHPGPRRGNLDFLSRWKECQIVCDYLNTTQCIRKPVVLVDSTSHLAALKRETSFKMNLSMWTPELKKWEKIEFLKQVALNQLILKMLPCLGFYLCEMVHLLILKANQIWDISCCCLYHFKSL